MSMSPVSESTQKAITEAGSRPVRLMIVLRCILLFETATLLMLLAWWVVLLGYGFANTCIGLVLILPVLVTIGVAAIRTLWRHRFRFGLRTMFALLSLAALISWWLAYYLPKYEREQRINRATAVVTKYRAEVHKQHVNGDENAPLLAYHIGFTGKPLTDGELADLAGHYSHLTGLALSGSRLTDRGLTCLSRFPLLAQIDISRTEVTAVGLSQLRHMPSLSILTLDGNQLRQLATAAEDALPLVRNLWLVSDGTDDQAISGLERWQNLNSVLVRGQITDNGLAQLSRVTALTLLQVDGCAGVTDEGLLHLANLKRLKLLSVVDTNATPSGGARLHELLPDCRVIVGQHGSLLYDESPRRSEEDHGRQ
jgi:hypothetical protein